MKFTKLLVLGSVLLSGSAMADLSYNCANGPDSFMLTINSDRSITYTQEDRGLEYTGELDLNNMGPHRGFNPNQLNYSGIISARNQGHGFRPGNQQRISIQIGQDMLRGTPRATAIKNGNETLTCGMLLKDAPHGPQGPGPGPRPRH